MHLSLFINILPFYSYCFAVARNEKTISVPQSGLPRLAVDLGLWCNQYLPFGWSHHSRGDYDYTRERLDWNPVQEIIVCLTVNATGSKPVVDILTYYELKLTLTLAFTANHSCYSFIWATPLVNLGERQKPVGIVSLFRKGASRNKVMVWIHCLCIRDSDQLTSSFSPLSCSNSTVRIEPRKKNNPFGGKA